MEKALGPGGMARKLVELPAGFSAFPKSQFNCLFNYFLLLNITEKTSLPCQFLDTSFIPG